MAKKDLYIGSTLIFIQSIVELLIMLMCLQGII